MADKRIDLHMARFVQRWRPDDAVTLRAVLLNHCRVPWPDTENLSDLDVVKLLSTAPSPAGGPVETAAYALRADSEPGVVALGGGAEAPAGQGMGWREAQQRAEQHVKLHGEAFPTVKRLAEAVGCSRRTMDKAIKHSRYLAARKAEADAARGAGGRAAQMPDAMLESTAQTREGQPDEPIETIEQLTAEQQADQRGEERRSRAVAKARR